MKYNISINQKAAFDNNWKLDFNQLAILDVIVNCIKSGKFETLVDNGVVWYWIKVTKIIDELPLLNIKERQVKNLLQGLIDCELIETYPHNKSHRKHYLRMGNNYEKYNPKECKKLHSDGKKLHSDYVKNYQPTTQKITEDNNNKDNYTKDKKREPPDNWKNWTEEKFIEEALKTNKQKDVLSPHEFEKFIGYWAYQYYPNGMLKFQGEKTWGMHVRLVKWKENQNKFN